MPKPRLSPARRTVREAIAYVHDMFMNLSSGFADLFGGHTGFTAPPGCD